MKKKNMMAIFLLILVFTSVLLVGSTLACQKDKDKKPHPPHPEHPRHPITPPPVVPPPHQQPPVGPPENITIIVNNTVVIVTKVTEIIIIEKTIERTVIVPKETVVIREVIVEKPMEIPVSQIIGITMILVGMTVIAYVLTNKSTLHKTVAFNETVSEDGTRSYTATESC